MHYVYVLLRSDKKIYVGYTKDLTRRYEEHRKGENISTKAYKVKLIYYEAYLNKSDALKREKKLKNGGQSRRHLKARLEESIDYVMKIPLEHW